MRPRLPCTYNLIHRCQSPTKTSACHLGSMLEARPCALGAMPANPTARLSESKSASATSSVAPVACKALAAICSFGSSIWGTRGRLGERMPLKPKTGKPTLPTRNRSLAARIGSACCLEDWLLRSRCKPACAATLPAKRYARGFDMRLFLTEKSPQIERMRRCFHAILGSFCRMPHFEASRIPF